MRDIVPFEAPQLDQLIRLVNVHLSAVVPGWGLSAPFLARHLERNPGEFVVDPWVAERVTFVAVERDRVVTAAHVQRFEREGDRVGDGFRGTGAIDWLVGWPSAADTSASVGTRSSRSNGPGDRHRRSSDAMMVIRREPRGRRTSASAARRASMREG